MHTKKDQAPMFMPLFRAATLGAVLLAGAGFAHAQDNTAGEGACHSAMAKAIGKHAAASAKAMATCLNAVLDGTSAGPCPDATAQAAIDKADAKALKATAKSCQSSCNPSGVACIGSGQCPPLDDRVENCNDGGKNPFESSDMGFPGALCEGLIGGSFTSPEDFGNCAGGLGLLVGSEMLANAYGPLDDVAVASPALTPEAKKCLASIVKATTKTAGKLASSVASCRVPQLTSASPAMSPDDCPTADTKTAEAITKGLAKVSDAVAKSCTDSTVQELALCGGARGATTTVAAAQSCLVEMVRQAAYSTAEPDTRDYATLSVVNAAFPKTAPARCGDGVVNQVRSQFLLIGEECDGGDDTACPGECLPPGDLFECTCGNVMRIRGFAVASQIDLDTGWSGLSHNSPGTDGTGPISTLTNCDCSQFGNTPETSSNCVGTSNDPVCDLAAEVQPMCAGRMDTGKSCDELGNEDGNPSDADCRACDAFAANAGDWCTGTARFCMGGTNSGDRCNQPSDCNGGTCSGAGQCIDGPFAGNGCTSGQNCGICVGGSNAGGTCSVPANCPGGACEVHGCGTKECIGGTNSGNPCSSDSQCTGNGRCAKTSDCLSQCYDANGVAQGSCWQQADCADGEVCRGRCNSDDTCTFRNNSAPLPLVGGGTGTCVISRHMTNISGTRNLVTGENSLDYELRSITFLAGDLNSRPCPVCGGYCADDAGSLAGAVCEGNCTGPERECRFGPKLGTACTDNSDCDDFACAAVPCRFDSDCSTGTCSDQGSPECRGATCRLDLTCAGGPHDGDACRIESITRLGSTSADCPPDDGLKLGSGLAISWTPITSESVVLESPSACDAPGYENYTCSCVNGSSGVVRSRPNSCNAACNDPDPEYFARPCANFTTCVGGSEAGAACDEDSDCSGGGTCSNDPRTCGNGSTGSCSVLRCSGGANAGDACIDGAGCPGGSCLAAACVVGDPATCSNGQDGACRPASCTIDANCDGGATCDDTCPNGRCVPLCAERGTCDGGEKEGLNCVLDSDCAAGGTCVKTDSEEGACAVGSAYHCNGKFREYLGCAPQDVGTEKNCEFGADGIEGNADDFPGAGICVQDIANCFVNNGAAEGGDTYNGEGDMTMSRQVSTYCIPSSGNAGVDGVAGLPGPGRVRATVQNIANRSSTP